jgi:hypothetical protein
MSIEALLQAMREENAARFERIDARFDATDTRFERIDARFERMEARFDASDAKLDQLSLDIAEKVEPLPAKIDLLAEGLMNLDEKLDREAADIRHEMRRGFVETQAMIKASHADLDRRVRVLEEKQ